MVPDLGQWLVRRIIRMAQQLREHGTEVKIHWVPGHMSVEGNQSPDKTTKEATEKAGTQRCPERFTSLTHVGRTILERKLK